MNNETILTKQVNELVIKYANVTLEATNFKAQVEIYADSVQQLTTERDHMRAVLDSDPALKELFEEAEAKLATANDTVE